MTYQAPLTDMLFTLRHAFGADRLAGLPADAAELADPFTPPVIDGYPGLAFLPNQQAEVDAFNAALKDYVGSDEMMESVGKYGYSKANLPDGTTTAELCKGDM